VLENRSAERARGNPSRPPARLSISLRPLRYALHGLEDEIRNDPGSGDALVGFCTIRGFTVVRGFAPLPVRWFPAPQLAFGSQTTN